MRKALWFLLAGGVLALLAGWVVGTRPDLAAQAATPLRHVIGNEGVAQLETAVFVLQDRVRQWQYGLGLAEPAAPWEVSAVAPVAAPGAEPTLLPAASPTPSPTTPAPTPLLPASPPAGNDSPPAATPRPTQTPLPTPLPTATPAGWLLPPVPPFGPLPGEGVWEPYLSGPAGQVVARRTFLQPDPERPYALVAVVAFDLAQTDLRFVLGLQEPALADGPRGTGVIPAGDKLPGRLLATFNGGFLATHGEYGAMQNGLTALPAKPGYATLAIDESGRVQLGEWGTDVDPAGNYLAWRQNARMVVHNGETNPRVENGSIVTWGGNINGNIVTWRSGLGLSQDEQVLYFFAGPSMSMPTLATAMQAVGAYNGMLLDINETWVHFAAVHPAGAELITEPLFPEGMETNVDRYLRISGRDFFYVVLKP
jgi:hypothetical protein